MLITDNFTEREILIYKQGRRRLSHANTYSLRVVFEKRCKADVRKRSKTLMLQQSNKKLHTRKVASQLSHHR